jgi:hypothetical protein
MPKVSDKPVKLRPYLFHGLDLEWEGRDQAVGECPFCTKSKFFVNVETGLWDCKVCGSKGNTTTFLRQLHAGSRDQTPEHEGLAESRKLLHSQTLSAWGVCRSAVSLDWLVPGYGAGGKPVQLYRYVKSPSGKWLLLATPECPHGLFGVGIYQPSKPDVYLCEGPWDGMALWEVIRGCKRTEDVLVPTGEESYSLLASANVLAVPGCNVFLPSWSSLFAGKRVFLMYDNDHPGKHPKTGNTIAPAGYEGMKRVAETLAAYEEPPREIHYLRWGDNGYDPSLPNGYDVRDLLSTGYALSARIPLLGRLLDKVESIPADWISGRTGAARRSGGLSTELLPCYEWKVLRASWQRAMKWTEGLDRALSVMLAVIISTELVGDQLWVKIIGPAACGKSTLCEALSTNKDYVLAKSTIRGFHSGFQSDRAGREDNSLLALVKNRTLVTKDGDTLLQAPNLSQILSEARDIYDRVSRTHYRNRMSRDYEGVSMTWLLCGTSSLRSIDSSELGERFLDCVIVEDIDEELEDEIGWRVANRADREMTSLSDGKMETRDVPELVKAKQLTGGYIAYLRENARVLIGGITTPAWALKRCQHLAKFVAYMRARPSTRQEEKAEREMSFRLISQLVRLAKCLAAVYNKLAVDEEVMRKVKRVALDTARGRTLDIVHYLYESGLEGTTLGSVAVQTGHGEAKELSYLQFLRKIGAAELYNRTVTTGYKTKRWRLTDRMRRLYREVHSNEE